MMPGSAVTGNKWKYVAAATEFTTSPLAGAIVGHYLDAYFRTDPLLTIILLLAGFIGGTVYLIKILRQPEDAS
jgi:F0F1-type ATP synthase assembly protein I